MAKTCTATQANRRAPDLRCGLAESAHTVHVDPATGTRWGSGGPPRGMRRKGYKKYANAKLVRRSRVAGRAP